MFNTFERAVAGRYLRARRGERFVSVIAGFSLIGIALGVATLIIVMSVMSGFRVELLSRILGFNGHLGVYARRRRRSTDFDALAAKIRAVPGVIAAIPVVEGQVLLTRRARRRRSAALCAASARTICASCASVSDHILRWLARYISGRRCGGDRRRAWRSAWGCGIGSQLTLISPQGQATAFGTIPRMRAYKVAAVFQVGMNEYDTELRVPAAGGGADLLPEARRGDADRGDGRRSRRVRRGQSRDLRGARRPPVRVIDWTQSNNSFFAAVEVERNVMFLILTLIILVAAFNVVSSLIMMVKDKTRDIAVLRTLGAGRGAVMRIFLMCGACVGVTGTLVGTLIGVLFCRNIETIRHVLEGADRHQPVQSRSLFPDPSAGGAGMAGGGAGDRHGAGAVAAGDALSELARGAHRSGGGAAA